MSDLPADIIHASCVAIGDKGVLIRGRSGAGKSDLALRLIDRGAQLVSDDYSRLERRADGRLHASPPPRIAGLIEVRGVGLVEMPHRSAVAVALLVDLERAVERMPDPATHDVAGVAVPIMAVAAFEPSTPIKIELMLKTLPL
jgi:serine kinase of HPr protein (carbohydrate metabolism regulator)